jgi:hypothetical protein
MLVNISFGASSQASYDDYDQSLNLQVQSVCRQTCNKTDRILTSGDASVGGVAKLMEMEAMLARG